MQARKKKGRRSDKKQSSSYAQEHAKGGFVGVHARNKRRRRMQWSSLRSQRMLACLRAVPPNERADRSKHFALGTRTDEQ